MLGPSSLSREERAGVRASLHPAGEGPPFAVWCDRRSWKPREVVSAQGVLTAFVYAA